MCAQEQVRTVPGDEKLFSIVDAQAGTAAEARAAEAVTGGESDPARALFGRSRGELLALMAELEQPAYRARQLEQALYRDWAATLEEVSTLPKALRQRLRERGLEVGLPAIEETFRSVDGTERYLIAGLDGQTVETVWMPGGDGGEAEDPVSGEDGSREIPAEAPGDGPQYASRGVSGDATGLRSVNPEEQTHPADRAVGLASNQHDAADADGPGPVFLSEAKDMGLSAPGNEAWPARIRPAQRRATICVSSQIGCAVNCRFCLTAKLGIIRNLTAGEIAGQVVAVLKRQGVHLGRDRINLVFMGMGEPFLNYDAWIAAMRLLTESVGLPASRMTVSTSGIVPGILRFADEPVRCKLAISLNASNDEVREQVMPITRKWDIRAVLAAVRTIPLGPRERITFEYVLLGGVNDWLEHADEVVQLVRGAGFSCYVNLIVWNPGPGTGFAEPEPAAVASFQARLIAQGVTAYIRRPRGRDIYAACGQLKRTTH